MCTKYTFLVILLLILHEYGVAQNAFVSTNLGNFVVGRRDEIMVGFKMKHEKMLTFCVERWHSDVHIGNEFFASDQSNYGGRLQIGVYKSHALKKHPNWRVFDRYFVVGGQHFVENQSFTAIFDFFGNKIGFAPSFKTSEKFWMAGVGLEIGCAFKYHQFFAGPSMISGYMMYFKENNRPENVFDRSDVLQKGLRLYFPTLRLVAGYYFK